jgi:pimeloyl-ACP methyl ester carboxylesterase
MRRFVDTRAGIVGTMLIAVLGSVPSSPAGAGAQTPDRPPHPAPGRLIDVGGWRLHLNCVGERKPGEPIVLLEAGKGDFSVEWSLVQPGVGRFARVCSYDRAGDGWSDLGPHPRTMRQIAYELHTLMTKADERPPFVLVGQSYGGWLVRVYQQTYPAEVAAIVLVDAGANDPRRYLPNGKLGRSSDLVTGQPIPAVNTATPLRIGDIPPAALAQMTAGLAAARASANDPPRDKLPLEARQMRTWALGQLGHVAAGVNPVENEEIAALRAARDKTPYGLGDLPLVVITRGLADEGGAEAAALEEEHRKDQASMAAMSRRGRQVIAEDSGHHVQIEQPGLVIRAIEEIVGGLRRR